MSSAVLLFPSANMVEGRMIGQIGCLREHIIEPLLQAAPIRGIHQELLSRLRALGIESATAAIVPRTVHASPGKPSMSLDALISSTVIGLSPAGTYTLRQAPPSRWESLTRSNALIFPYVAATSSTIRMANGSPATGPEGSSMMARPQCLNSS